MTLVPTYTYLLLNRDTSRSCFTKLFFAIVSNEISPYSLAKGYMKAANVFCNKTINKAVILLTVETLHYRLYFFHVKYYMN